MNFKKTWKRFFTVSRASEGFTLVELIVVIAILAILAGIAVPAYSGYIKKANKAADLQLLGAVNTAFAAAVLESGHDVSDVAAANITAARAATFARTATAEAGWSVGGAAVAFHEGQAPADFSDTFMRYYGNPNATFKVITSLAWDPATGAFCDIVDISNSGGSVSYVYNGSAITVSAQAITNLQNSTFGQEIGGEALLGRVDTVSGIGAFLLDQGGEGNVMENLIYGNDDGEAYFANLQSTLNLSDDEFNAILDGENGYDFLANSVVLTAAQNTADIDTSFLGQTGSASALRTQLDSSDPAEATEAMSMLAMTYAMYTSYANYSNDETMLNNLTRLEQQQDYTGMTNILAGLESEGFRTYLSSADGQADLAAYQSAMQIVNDATQNNPSATVQILQNGFTDDELSTLLGSIMK